MTDPLIRQKWHRQWRHYLFAFSFLTLHPQGYDMSSSIAETVLQKSHHHSLLDFIEEANLCVFTLILCFSPPSFALRQNECKKKKPTLVDKEWSLPTEVPNIRTKPLHRGSLNKSLPSACKQLLLGFLFQSDNFRTSRAVTVGCITLCSDNLWISLHKKQSYKSISRHLFFARKGGLAYNLAGRFGCRMQAITV